MSPVRTPLVAEFDGFGVVRVTDFTYKTEVIDVTSGGHVGSVNSPIIERTPGITEVTIGIEGDFGHRQINGKLAGVPGVFHKVRTSQERNECTTFFVFQKTP